MAQPDLESPISEVKTHFNRLFDVTIADIRRAFMVKSAALDRVESDDPKIKASGYYHLSKIIDLQLGVYRNYLERFGKVRLPNAAQEKLSRLEELQEGFIKGYFIKIHLKRIIEAISLLEKSKFPDMHRKVSILYQIIMSQREFVKVAAYQDSSTFSSKEEARRIRKSNASVMSPEEMLKFHRLLAEEEAQSNELIREVKEARNIFIQALNAIGPLQKSFSAFLKNAKDFRDEREESLKAFFSKAALLVSAYFLVKVTSVWGAESILNFSNDEEFKTLIFMLQHRIMLYDNLADTLAASPAVYAALRSGALKNIVKNGFKTLRQAYLEGESDFKRTVEELLSSGRKTPEF